MLALRGAFAACARRRTGERRWVSTGGRGEGRSATAGSREAMSLRAMCQGIVDRAKRELLSLKASSLARGYLERVRPGWKKTRDQWKERSLTWVREMYNNVPDFRKKNWRDDKYRVPFELAKEKKRRRYYWRLLKWFLVVCVAKVVWDSYLSKTKLGRIPFKYEHARTYSKHDWSELVHLKVASIMQMELWMHIMSLVPMDVFEPYANAYGFGIWPLYKIVTNEPPRFWVVRMDIPAAGSAKVVQASEFELPLVARGELHPVSPGFKGAQILWIAIRTWERGEWVCRLLAGRQIGGNVDLRGKNLLPCMTVYRSDRLMNLRMRPHELDRVDDDGLKYRDMAHAYITRGTMEVPPVLSPGGSFDASTRVPVGEVEPIEVKWDEFGDVLDEEECMEFDRFEVEA
ncbi:uncharacterized protein LOC126320572 [Schistocerca gregaria]|uniref:uncharacterized protein LOC126320572 n=1 Tax=Schistocerca gregaria TaxID=7010 RepID=UPI00211EA53D|nr:uncharacterized protein LOC126320572 [Schistocerca gregaria]XP_049849993.1 uncharacterized protein LOC126320572 [Schistocerca gregaria]XP_049849994.1 uncharacterized protein LOC126320572 [Schistocerca gregaria]